MQIKRFLTFCVVATLMCSSNVVAKKDNHTIVSGQVINRTADDLKVMVWNLCDPFDDSSMEIRLLEDGQFHVETEGINLFHNMTLRYGDFINFFAAPSDPFFGIDDSQNFITMMFPYHLGAYMFTKIFSDARVMAAGEQSDYSTMVRNGIRILMNEPASLSRDAMAWQFLSEMMEAFPELYDSVPEVRTVFTSSELNDKFSNFVQQYNKKSEFLGTQQLVGINYLELDGTVTALPEGDIFAHLAQKYSNKVIYIDVYATWCGPCRAEMKDSAPALHKLMKGKDVVFVNFCLASDVAEWRKIVTDFNLTENYRFDSDASTLFVDKYNISIYPSYILIGKDGEISTFNAKRPSHLAKASKQIDDLLEIE